MRWIVTFARLLCLALFAATVAYFLAMKARWLRPRPTLIAGAVIVLCVGVRGAVGRGGALGARGRRGAGAAAGRGCLLAGSLLVFGGGLANWAFSLQGFVIMGEGEAAPFFHGIHLQAFDPGPLSNVEEMELVLYLDEIELEPTHEGCERALAPLGPDDRIAGVCRLLSKPGFVPVSSLRLVREGERPHRFDVSPLRSAADGTLRFHQGVFGYAPHVVIRHGDGVLFDQVVPFTTRRDDERRIVFVGEFTVARHGLSVQGEIMLDSLGDEMRGHPELFLSVDRNGVHLGAGTLRMGGFAELANDHHVGFTGLKKWAEIDISRKQYVGPMLAGAYLFGFGLVLLAVGWGVARWRRR